STLFDITGCANPSDRTHNECATACARGEPGPTGPTGATGPPGAQGASGQSPLLEVLDASGVNLGPAYSLSSGTVVLRQTFDVGPLFVERSILTGEVVPQAFVFYEGDDCSGTAFYDTLGATDYKREISPSTALVAGPMMAFRVVPGATEQPRTPA